MSPLRASRTALVATARMCFDAVVLHDLPETVQRRERRVDGLRSNGAREKVSRPSSTPRDASSMIRGRLLAGISAMTRRIALAPMSSTATNLGALC